jgi:hypothetical protein
MTDNRLMPGPTAEGIDKTKEAAKLFAANKAPEERKVTAVIDKPAVNDHDDFMHDFNTKWREMNARRDELAGEVNRYNKHVLFAAMTAAGVHSVTVHFDGCGDEGQIEQIKAYGEGKSGVELPTTPTPLTVRVIDAHVDDVKVKDKEAETLQDAIETVCYEYLEQTHGGWEISDGEADGAYGDIIFDIARGTITLDYNQRYIASENYEHEF